MLRATPMALALVQAANKTPKTFNNWVARSVAEKVDHSSSGVVAEPDIKVRAKYKTRQQIASNCGVIV